MAIIAAAIRPNLLESMRGTIRAACLSRKMAMRTDRCRFAIGRGPGSPTREPRSWRYQPGIDPTALPSLPNDAETDSIAHRISIGHQADLTND